jgi:hypothetical protein
MGGDCLGDCEVFGVVGGYLVVAGEFFGSDYVSGIVKLLFFVYGIIVIAF